MWSTVSEIETLVADASSDTLIALNACHPCSFQPSLEQTSADRLGQLHNMMRPLLHLTIRLLPLLLLLLLLLSDANDAAQFAELKTQGDLTRRAWEKNVQVRLSSFHFRDWV